MTQKQAKQAPRRRKRGAERTLKAGTVVTLPSGTYRLYKALKKEDLNAVLVDPRNPRRFVHVRPSTAFEGAGVDAG